MTSIFDKDFKLRDLIGKVILLAKQSRHATRILPRAYRCAFCMHVGYIKTSFFQGLLQTFLLAIVSHHLLDFTMKFGGWVIVRDHSVFLTMLFATITFVHLKSFECIFRKCSMSRRLIKDKQSLTSGM